MANAYYPHGSHQPLTGPVISMGLHDVGPDEMATIPSPGLSENVGQGSESPALSYLCALSTAAFASSAHDCSSVAEQVPSSLDHVGA